MRLPLLIGLHLLISAVGEALFAFQFGHNPRVIATHVLLIVEWDLALFLIVKAIASFTTSTAWPGLAFRLLLAVTCTLQVYLYALNVVSNVSWGRNMTGTSGRRIRANGVVGQRSRFRSVRVGISVALRRHVAW